MDRYNIGKIKISNTNINKTLDLIEKQIKIKESSYICVTNARTSHLANKDNEYCKIQNNSYLTVPDGMPLVWIAHNKGFKEVGKVSGMDLMKRIFTESVKNSYSHYFYGCSNATIDLMVENIKKDYYGIQIKGAVSPPFQPLEKFDIDALATELNSLKPTFFWCGLGAPKQERLMALLQPKLDSTICVGVGLAFEYFAGTVKRVPVPIQRMGLEWFYRCAQQPIKARRFIVPFFWIIKYILMSKILKK